MVDRAFIMALLLTVSGLVFCGLFLPLEKPAYRLTSAKTMAAVNTAALFAFVLPFYFISAIRDGSEALFRKYSILIIEGEGPVENAAVFLRRLPFAPYLRWAWLLGAAAFLAYQFFGYLRLVARIREGGFRLDDDGWGACFRRLEEEYGLRDVELLGCCRISTPCTVGLRKHYLLIPSSMVNSFDGKEKEFILRHELSHVLHRDTLWTCLVIFLGAANWFNPLFHFLRGNLSAWQEMACDEEATKGMTQEERARYCRLVVGILEQEEEPVRQKAFRLGFDGNDYRFYRKRLEGILGGEKRGSPFGRAAVAAAVALAMFLGNDIAKEADCAVNMLFAENVHIAKRGDLEIIEHWRPGARYDFMEEDKRLSEEFEPLEDAAPAYGVIPLSTGALPLRGAAEPEHPHALQPIVLVQEDIASDGSCESTYYEGRECAVCGAAWKGIQTGKLVNVNHNAEIPSRENPLGRAPGKKSF